MLPRRRSSRWWAKALAGLAGCILILALVDSKTAPLVSSQAGVPVTEELTAEAGSNLGIVLPAGAPVSDSQPNFTSSPPSEPPEISSFVIYGVWQGGISSVSYTELLEKNPERAVEKAIRGMLPKNSLGRDQFRKLKVYAGGEHPHAAQQPTTYAIGQVAQ